MLLLISNKVLVYRKKGGWKGPFKVIAVTDKDVIILNVIKGTLTFRNTYIKLYTQPKEEVLPEADLIYVTTKERDNFTLAL